MIRQFASRQFLGFLATGSIAAAVNVGSRVLYSHWLSFSPAVVLAYVTGMITAFVLARLFVFQSSTRKLNEAALYFILVNMFAVLQTWAISMLLLYYVLPRIGVTSNADIIAHTCGVVVPVFTSYLGHKHFSFR